jgi:hypothetical protein
MNRRTAKVIHETTNLTFWMENPEWQSGDAAFDLACKGLRALPFSLHEAQKKAFFDTSKLIAVNSETVVAANGREKVDKFMFRYPGKISLEKFRDQVHDEVKAVTQSLAQIALATEVNIKPAYIFKKPKNPVAAVAQTQPRLDLGIHRALDLAELVGEAPSRSVDRTMSDLESMLEGVDVLTACHGYYPDVANSSGNLRRNILDGAVTLIDVMPVYANGNRLIDDRPPGLLEHTLENIEAYQELVGQYGA